MLIRDGRATVSFCLSTQIKLGLNRFQIYGPVTSMTVDLMSGSVIKNKGQSYRSYHTFVVPPLNSAHQHLANAMRNAVNIVRWRMHQDSGMKELIQQLYHSISSGGPPLIPYRDLMLTARIMESIFAHIRPRSARSTVQASA